MGMSPYRLHDSLRCILCMCLRKKQQTISVLNLYSYLCYIIIRHAAACSINRVQSWELILSFVYALFQTQINFLFYSHPEKRIYTIRLSNNNFLTSILQPWILRFSHKQRVLRVQVLQILYYSYLAAMSWLALEPSIHVMSGLRFKF